MPLDTMGNGHKSGDLAKNGGGGTFSPASRVLEDSDSEEEIVYCRSADIDDLNLMSPGGRKSDYPHGIQGFLQALLNTHGQSCPDEHSATLSSRLTVVYTLLAGVTAFILSHSPDVGSLVTLVVLGGMTFLMVSVLVFLSCQPRTSQVLAFKVPLVPFLPGVSIFINLYLMLKLSAATWVRFGVWMAVGFVVYFGYGIRNSSEEYKRRGKPVPVT